MSTRKEMLFSAKKQSAESSIIPATVSFRHNKGKALVEPLKPHEKMICALRKVLADMSSENEDGCNYYIANNKVQVVRKPTTTDGKPGEAQSYQARGRCRIGVCHANNTMTSMLIEFDISYRDVVDDRGLADVEYFDPTVIDKLDKSTPLDVSAIA